MSQLDEPWVRAALSDDCVVADLLVGIGGLSQKQPATTTAVGPLNWTVRRQRRSRPPPQQNGSPSKKASRHVRASPTTPLSLSAGTSQDGSDESSRARAGVSGASYPERSKVDEDGEKAVSKKSRKRKTLAELKCEESSLAKEGIGLRMEIAALRLNLEKQWATNENLKRMKNQRQSINHEASLQQHSSSDQCPRKNAEFKPGEIFVIPDLNIPLEDDANAELLCGVI